jgi:hypothetical protein
MQTFEMKGDEFVRKNLVNFGQKNTRIYFLEFFTLYLVKLVLFYNSKGTSNMVGMKSIHF